MSLAFPNEVPEFESVGFHEFETTVTKYKQKHFGIFALSSVSMPSTVKAWNLILILSFNSEFSYAINSIRQVKIHMYYFINILYTLFYYILYYSIKAQGYSWFYCCALLTFPMITISDQLYCFCFCSCFVFITVLFSIQFFSFQFIQLYFDRIFFIQLYIYFDLSYFI